MVGSIALEGMAKLLNPEARVTPMPMILMITRALGIVRANHHFEVRNPVLGLGISCVLPEEYRLRSSQPQ